MPETGAFRLLDVLQIGAPGRTSHAQHAVVADDDVSAFVHIWGATAVADRSQEALRNAIRALFTPPAPPCSPHQAAQAASDIDNVQNNQAFGQPPEPMDVAVSPG